jgi:hypothetical protein
MAIVKVIEINANTSKAKKDLESLNKTLDEQRQILIELEKELVKTEQLQATTSKTNFAAQKQLTEQSNHLKDAIKDQKLGLRTLNVERRTATQSVKELSSEEANQSKIIKLLDTVTGGYATKAIKLYNGFKEGAKGLKSFNIGLGGMKKALIATGIGALVVAVGTLIAYWDDITGAINGASSEQTKLLDESKELVKSNQDILSATEASENTLRMQGKSEKEILALKIKQTDEVIAATEIQLQQQKDLKKSQTEAAERNQKIAAGIIAFLSLPVTILLGAVDALTSGLAKIGVLSEATNFVEKFAMGAASLIGFDPKDVEKEGAETVKETEKQLAALKNKRDGFRLTQQSDAKKDAEKKKQDKQKADEKELKIEKEKADALERIRKGLIDTEAEERAEKLRLIKADYDEQIKLAEKYYGLESEKVKELKDAQRLALKEQETKFEEQDKEIAEKKSKEAADKLVLEKENDLLSFEEQRAIIAQREALLLEDETINEKNRIELQKQFAKAKEDIDKAEREFKEQEYRTTYGNLQNILSVGGKKLQKVSKALAIADVVRTASKSVSETISSIGVANAKSVAASPLTGGMPFVAINTIKGALQIGSTIASSVKAIQSINSESKVVASAPSVASSGGGGGGAPVSQPPAFNVVGASGTNQLADAIGGQSQQPIKAFVVSNDVTSAQSMDRNIVSGASI